MASAVKRMRADPVPPVVNTEIHGTLSDAVHAQPASVSNSNSTVPPEAGTVALVGSLLKVQPCPWFTVNVRPAMVNDPERDGPVVAAALKRTVPLPLPAAPDAIVSHDALLVAVHVQPAAAVTATLPSPPPAPIDCVSGSIAYVHPCDCVTVTVWPPMVSVPVRGGPVVAATVNVTLPLAEPDVAPWMEIHGTAVDAVHAHALPAVTVTVAEPPVAPNVCDDGATTIAHDAGGGGGGGGGGAGPGPGGAGDGEELAGCVTEKSSPATTSVPVRATLTAGATRKMTAPGPVPLEPCVTVIHGALLAAVHGQAAVVVTAIVLLPPASGALWPSGAIAYAHPCDCVTLKR